MIKSDEFMAKVEDCPGFETFGADVKAAREKLGLSRRELAEKIGVDPRYLANIKLKATIPSMPLVVQLFRLCNLPAEKYFNPVLWQEETEQCQRVKYKVQLCPDKYLPAIESAIDELMKLDKQEPFPVCEEAASCLKRAFFVRDSGLFLSYQLFLKVETELLGKQGLERYFRPDACMLGIPKPFESHFV